MTLLLQRHDQPIEECSLMETKQMKHYSIWSVGQKGEAPEERIKSVKISSQDIHARSKSYKHDDLQTSLMLYSYGLPIEATVRGRCALPSGQALKCRTKVMSSDSVDFAYEETSSARYDRSHVGSPVHVDLEKLGSFKGAIAAQDKEGFQVAVDAKSKSAFGSKLADFSLTRDASRETAAMLGPQMTRIEPKIKSCDFEDHEGILRSGIIVNVSQVDALIRARYIPPKPAIIAFKGPKRYTAEITSVFAIGFMARFCVPIPISEFTDDLILSGA